MQGLVSRLEEAANGKHFDKVAEIREEFHSLLNQYPEEPNLIYYTATTELILGHHGVAVSLLKRALAYQPTFPEAWNNLGNAWRTIHNLEKARQGYEKALLQKESTEHYNNLSTLYINEGNPEGGLEYAHRALELDPDNAQAHWNLGLILLEMCEWERGFEEYEAGLFSGDRPNRQFGENIPYWNGETDKTVVVYGEQGMGDEIMFSSCVPEISKDTRVILECHPRMENLFRRSFPEVFDFYPTRKEGTIDWPTAYPIGYRVGIGSLFKFYGMHVHEPYLKPDPEKVAAYRERLEATGHGPYIGIGWYGGTLKTRHDQRSFKLKQLLPLLEQKATFVSLQYTEDADEKVQRFYEDTGIRIHHWPEVVRARDYDDTVALIAALDLCILPCTTAVHVCGAIGQNCWTLTPDKKAWRYCNRSDPEHMPMYGNHVELIHQNGSWETTIDSVSLRLEQFINEREKAISRRKILAKG